MKSEELFNKEDGGEYYVRNLKRDRCIIGRTLLVDIRKTLQRICAMCQNSSLSG